MHSEEKKSVETIEKGILFNCLMLTHWLESLKVCSFFVCLDSITKVLFISCCSLAAKECGKRKGISSYYGKRNIMNQQPEKKAPIIKIWNSIGRRIKNLARMCRNVASRRAPLMHVICMRCMSLHVVEDDLLF